MAAIPLTKARQYFPQAILRTLYFSLCHCCITYGLNLWGVTYNSYIRTLDRLQHRILRIIGQGEPVGNIFQSQPILLVRMLRDYKIAVSINRIPLKIHLCLSIFFQSYTQYAICFKR